MGGGGRPLRQRPAPAGPVMDPLTLEVVQHSLAGIAEEMGATLRRTARSPNITEREDASCALTTPAGGVGAPARPHPPPPRRSPAHGAAAPGGGPPPPAGDSALLHGP